MREHGTQTTPGPDQGPVHHRSSSAMGPLACSSPPEPPSQAPRRTARLLAGKRHGRGLAELGRKVAALRHTKQMPPPPSGLAAPGLDATPCLTKPLCDAGSLQGGEGGDEQAWREKTPCRTSSAGKAPALARRAGREWGQCCRNARRTCSPLIAYLPLTVARMGRDPHGGAR